MTRLRTLLLVSFVVGSLLVVPSPAAAESVSGSVVLEDGSADGDRVTVTPIDENYRKVGDPINTTVKNSTFTARGVADAPLYYVRVVHEDVAHYDLVRSPGNVSIDLSAAASGRLVNESGAGQAGQTLTLVSPYGSIATRTETGENGTFTIDPLQPNTTYYLQFSMAGVPHNHTLRTGADGGDHRVVAREPTTDLASLEASGGSPASHVIQLAKPDAGEPVTAVEALTLRNTADRPFVGPVELRLPAGAQADAAMYEDQRIPVTQDGRTVAINATVPANDRVRVGVAYTIEGTTLDRELRYGTDVAAVSLQGYDLANVEYSQNLEQADAPIPLLIARNVSADGESLTIELPESTAGASAPTEDDDGGAPLDSPAAPLLVGLVGAVTAGAIAYRVL